MNNRNRSQSAATPFHAAQNSGRFPHLFFREFLITESKLAKWLRDSAQRVLQIPATLTEVLMRYNFGERYYSFGSVVFFVILFLLGGQLASEFGGSSSWDNVLRPIMELQPDSTASYIFLVLFAGMGCYHYMIIRRRIWQHRDLEHFSLYDGTPHEWLWGSLEWLIHNIPTMLQWVKGATVWLLIQAWLYAMQSLTWLHKEVVKLLHRIPYLQRFSFTFSIPLVVKQWCLIAVKLVDQLLDQLIGMLDRLLSRVQFNEYIVKRYTEPILVTLIGVGMYFIMGQEYNFIGLCLMIGGVSSFIRAQIEFGKGRRYLLAQNDKRIVGKQLAQALDRKTPAKKVAGVSLPFLPARDDQERQTMWAALQTDTIDHQLQSNQADV